MSMTDSIVPVNLFLVFFSAAKRAFSLLHAMFAGSGVHQTIFVDSGFHLQPFPKLLQLHVINITRNRKKVKRKSRKVIHNCNETESQFAGGRGGCQAKKNPPANGRGLVLEDMKLGPLYMVARGLYLLLRFKL